MCQIETLVAKKHHPKGIMMRRSHREARNPEDEGRKSKPASSQQQQLPLSPFPKTRCYRLNLEKPFDISQTASCSSPLFRNRDYSGPITEADLPPVQGPAEYYPPPHLCRQEELRRHSWNGNSAIDLMANLQVSESTESANNETSVAISTARIFRGITVDRNGVILTQNARAMRSRKNGDKNKLGEKSRQAAKIDKAKDLIDDVMEGGAMVDGNVSLLMLIDFLFVCLFVWYIFVHMSLSASFAQVSNHQSPFIILSSRTRTIQAKSFHCTSWASTMNSMTWFATEARNCVNRNHSPTRLSSCTTVQGPSRLTLPVQAAVLWAVACPLIIGT